MKNLENIRTFVSSNILYFIFIIYFIYIFGFYFFSDHIPIFEGLTSNLKTGYILGGDSSTYIQSANDLINFKIPEGKALNYLGYSLFIAIFQYLKLNLSFVVLSQIFLTFVSSLCVYKISKKISSHEVAIFVLSLYLFYIPLQIWNFYILTDTIFTCLTIFIVYFFIFFKKRYLPIIILLIIFYIILRPHGIIILPCLTLSLIICLFLKKKFKLLLLAIIPFTILLLPTLSLLNFYLENENILNSIIKKGIIWGYEDQNNYLDYKFSDYDNNDLASLLNFFKNNLFSYTIAFLKKIWFFSFRIRPYYSDFHNFYIIFYNFIYWPAAIFGFISLANKNSMGKLLMYFLIIFFTFAAGITWADYDGRFSLYIIPIVFIFSGVGYHNILNTKIIKALKD